MGRRDMKTAVSKTPLLTIAVCTWNRAELLRDCLDSIAAQPDISLAYEVLVVDNGSSDNTQEVCKQYMGKLPGFRSVIELKTGLSNARNRAIAEAAGTAIAFVDDDAILCDNWLQVVEKTLLRGDYAAFGGPYDAWHRYATPPPWFDDEWESYTLKCPDGHLPTDIYPSGCNCVISLDWCRRFDGFSTELGMEGDKIRYGEESELFEQIRNAGGTLGWANEMLVHHSGRKSTASSGGFGRRLLVAGTMSPLRRRHSRLKGLSGESYARHTHFARSVFASCTHALHRASAFGKRISLIAERRSLLESEQ